MSGRIAACVRFTCAGCGHMKESAIFDGVATDPAGYDEAHQQIIDLFDGAVAWTENGLGMAAECALTCTACASMAPAMTVPAATRHSDHVNVSIGPRYSTGAWSKL